MLGMNVYFYNMYSWSTTDISQVASSSSALI